VLLFTKYLTKTKAYESRASRSMRVGLPEDREDDREPDGDGVHDDAEAGEEQHEADSRQTVPLRCRLCAVQHVEPQSEGKVGGHRQSVGHSQSSQDAVGRRYHVPTCQHDDVQRVGDDAEDADDAGQVTVILLVPVVEDGQLASTGIYVLDTSCRVCLGYCLGVISWYVSILKLISQRHSVNSAPQLATQQHAVTSLSTTTTTTTTLTHSNKLIICDEAMFSF